MPLDWTAYYEPFGISLSFSRENVLAANIATKNDHRIDDEFHFGTDPIEHTFATSLHFVHERLRDRIYAAPTNERPELINAFASWARRLAEDPLAPIRELPPPGQAAESDSDSTVTANYIESNETSFTVSTNYMDAPRTI
jgi:hypothetical protein